MPLSDAQYKDLIILQVGDDAAGTLAAQIDLLWESYADSSSSAVRALYTKIGAIDLMLARARHGVDFQALDGASVKLDQLFQHLRQMRADALAAIAAGEEAADALAGAVSGLLTTTAPIAPPCATGPDANDGAYRGSPYRRRWRP